MFKDEHDSLTTFSALLGSKFDNYTTYKDKTLDSKYSFDYINFSVRQGYPIFIDYLIFLWIIGKFQRSLIINKFICYRII